MTARKRFAPMAGCSGMTLVEILIALIVLAIGILAFMRILPSGSRSQVSTRMQTTAAQYANESFESLRGLSKTSAALSIGRHPASGFDSLGTNRTWRRYYVVSQMPAPLDSLLKLEATVCWQSTRPESVRLTGYLMP